jgi:hypothetical protein
MYGKAGRPVGGGKPAEGEGGEGGGNRGGGGKGTRTNHTTIQQYVAASSLYIPGCVKPSKWFCVDAARQDKST